MITLTWLHLTDLHIGMSEQDWLLPGVEDRLFGDLTQLHERTSPWDLVLFTGDLVQRGDAGEFAKVEKFFQRLWALFDGFAPGSRPLLLAVPGNHDLIRPGVPLPAEVRLLRQWANQSEVQDEFWKRPECPYRKVIDAAFTNYTDWWGRQEFRPGNGLQTGSLPGEFSFTLEKDGARFGLVGLNSTFLQLVAGDCKGTLALHSRQFHQACGGNGNAWAKRHHACLLLTHQPPDWLTADSQADLEQHVTDHERFAVHLFGHMHETEYRTSDVGGTGPRRYWQGRSLFGLEYFGEGQQRSHGYAVGRITITPGDERAKMSYWPRQFKLLGGSWEPAADERIKVDLDWHTEPVDVKLLQPFGPKAKAPPPDALTKPVESIVAPRLVRPKLPPLPRLDDNAPVRHQFLGRHVMLNDVAEALRHLAPKKRRKGATDGKNGPKAPAANVKLIWVHGFGGMGKSWFLRRAMIEAQERFPKIRTALVDWDVQKWRAPLTERPVLSRHVFEAIAYRLAQQAGSKALDPYWEAVQQVRAQSLRHWDLRTDFKECLARAIKDALALLQAADSPAPAAVPQAAQDDFIPIGDTETGRRRREGLYLLEDIMVQAGLWFPDPRRRVRAINRIQNNPIEWEELFATWAEQWLGPEADEAVTQPDELLCRTLRECIRRLGARSPIFLILDTCELLKQEHVRWLLRLVADLINGTTSLLLLVGSRSRPDAFVEPGDKRGWRHEIDTARFRIIPFDNDVHFTIDEIRQALDRLVPPAPSNPNLAAMLHRITLGVPLGVNVLLEMHRQNNLVLSELESSDAPAGEELNRSVAVTRVIEEVSGRFLKHLRDDPVTQDDYQDVMVLALLPRYQAAQLRAETLRGFWGISNINDRLKPLAQRYSIAAEGDLHPTVRDYFRRRWRTGPPSQLPAIIDRLGQVIEGLKPEDEPGEGAHFEWTMWRLNILGWQQGERAYPAFLRALTVGLAFELPVWELIALAGEIRPTTGKGHDIKRKLVGPDDDERYRFSLSDSSEITNWLQTQVTADWSPFECACLDLLAGLRIAQQQVYTWRFDPQYRPVLKQAVVMMERAFEVLGRGLARRREVGRLYLQAVYRLTVYRDDCSEIVDRAHKWAVELDFQAAGLRNELGNLLHNAKRYEEAVGAFRMAIELDPTDEDNHYDLGRVLYEKLQRNEEAEAQVRKAIAIKPAKLEAWALLGQILQNSSRMVEAEEAFRKALSLVPDGSDQFSFQANSLAWDLYIARSKLEEAEQLARRALEQVQTDIDFLQTLAAIIVRRDRWDDAADLIRRWATEVEDADLFGRWHENILLFRDAVQLGHAAELAALLGETGREVWLPMQSALLKIASRTDGNLSDVDEPLREAVAALIAQLHSDERPANCPLAISRGAGYGPDRFR